MSRNLTIAITQMACTPDFEENRDRAEKLIREAVSKGAQVSDRVASLIKEAKLTPEEFAAKVEAKKS